MNLNNKIGWCTATWNPITGCTPISEGCQNCWAKRMAETRLRGRCEYDAKEPFKVTFHPNRLKELSHYRQPKIIFICSMGDLFHDDVTDEQIFQILNAGLQGNRRHTFLVLTKRPKRMREWFDNNARKVTPEWPDLQLWLGVTAENQARADERIPILLSITAAVHFVSVEPILAPVDLEKYFYPLPHYGGDTWKPENGLPNISPKLAWVIVGPETGPNKRPCNQGWIENLYQQCKMASVPFWDKRKNYITRERP